MYENKHVLKLIRLFISLFVCVCVGNKHGVFHMIKLFIYKPVFGLNFISATKNKCLTAVIRQETYAAPIRNCGVKLLLLIP